MGRHPRGRSHQLCGDGLINTYRYDSPCGAGKSCRIQPFFVAVSTNLPNVGFFASKDTLNSDGVTATASMPSWSRKVLKSTADDTIRDLPPKPGKEEFQ